MILVKCNPYLHKLLGQEVIDIRTLNIAHRGASSTAPENTIAAFDQALEIGADGIEFDVHLSKDNVPVIIHDEEIDRTTTGSGMVKNFSLAELKKYDAGSWFALEYSGQKIPTLDDIFTRYADSDLLLNLELKNEITPCPGIEETVVQYIEQHNLQDRVLISSFNHDSLVECRRLNPAIRTGMIYILDIKEPWQHARSLGCYSVHPLFYYLQTPEILSGFKEHNLPLYPWTVNDPEQMEVFAAAGIEAIITDYPQELKNILDRSK